MRSKGVGVKGGFSFRLVADEFYSAQFIARFTNVRTPTPDGPLDM